MRLFDYTEVMIAQTAMATIDGQPFIVPKFSDGSWYASCKGTMMQFSSLSSAIYCIVTQALGMKSTKDVKEFRAMAYDREFTDLDDLYEFEMQEFAMDESYDGREAM